MPTLGMVIRNIRRDEKMSQEKLAELIGVSRQAVSKWERDIGTPNLSNLISLSDFYHGSLDELLQNDLCNCSERKALYKSILEYSTDIKKDYNINLVNARKVIIQAQEHKMVQICLMSNEKKTVQKNYIPNLYEKEGVINIVVQESNFQIESCKKRNLDVIVLLPAEHIGKISIVVNAVLLNFKNIKSEKIAVSGNVKSINLQKTKGYLDIKNGLR